MPTVTVGLGVTSVQASKPDYQYGSDLAQAPVQSAASLALLRATIDLPKNAVITSAKVRLNQYDGPWSGSVTLTLLRHLAAYTYKVTWNTKPDATTSASQTRSGAAAGSWWEIDVTSDVQAIVSGVRANYGWRLASSSGTLHKIRTHNASASKPVLVITYEVPAKVPTNLNPQGGAVSMADPVLTFNTDPSTVAVQVQIDPAANGTSPEFDSGEVAATYGMFDLPRYLNRVTNGDFETNASGWTAVTNCNIARSTAQAKAGAASLALTAVGAGDMSARTSIGAVAGESVTATAFSRAGTTSRNTRLTMTWHDINGAVVGSTATGSSVADSNANFNANPTLTATAPAGAVEGRLHVQVLSAGAGEVHYFDVVRAARTASTALYAGLADGATTSWRVRSKTGYGWSAWSAWVSFSRDNFDALTITAPGFDSADGSPPITWTFAGTQIAWEAALLDADGKVITTSGVVSGTDTAWTPTKGLTEPGETGVAMVRVWDNVDRVATVGWGVYVEKQQLVTYTPDSSVPEMSTLLAATSGVSPGVVLTGTRASGGIPDEVIVYRNGTQIDRVPGVDIFTSSTAFTYTDWTAPMHQEAEYQLIPVVNNMAADGGPTATVTPKCQGLWLVDPATGVAIVLWNGEEGSFEGEDTATVHLPIAEGSKPVRRRLRAGVMTGTEQGLILDTPVLPSVTGQDVLDAFATFRANDAGTVYRLVDGHWNRPVYGGNFIDTPTPQSGPELVAKGRFSFWQAGEF